MVQETHPRVDPVFSASVQIQKHPDIGFPGFAYDLRLPHFRSSPASRTSFRIFSVISSMVSICSSVPMEIRL